MATFLLVHGAWHGSWCWNRVLPLLQSAGHRAVSLDLPAHGADATPPCRVTLKRYARAVRAQAAAQRERVVAVGHSMGGMAITQAAREDPAAFSLLVYLCAFVPAPGDSLYSLARADSRSLAPAAVRWRPIRTTIRPERAGALFYGDCSDEDAQWAIARLRPTPTLPMFQRVSGKNDIVAPRAYIECLEDRVISVDRQRQMVDRFDFDRVLSMETSHSPFFSAPDELVTHLESLSRLAHRGESGVSP